MNAEKALPNKIRQSLFDAIQQDRVDSLPSLQVKKHKKLKLNILKLKDNRRETPFQSSTDSSPLGENLQQSKKMQFWLKDKKEIKHSHKLLCLSEAQTQTPSPQKLKTRIIGFNECVDRVVRLEKIMVINKKCFTQQKKQTQLQKILDKK